jgi:hypothetical protein
MARNPKITFIGAGSTVFMKNIVGDVLQRPALSGATIALMDINPQRLEESAIVVNKLISTLGAKAKAETYSDQRKALAGADFVVVAFQIGGYEPCTVTDFECRRNTACARRSPTRSASAASCAACAPCRICGRSARTCSPSAPRRSCCNTSTRWRSTPGRSRRSIRRSSRSASAIRCRARRWNWPMTSTFPTRKSATARPASTTWPST